MTGDIELGKTNIVALQQTGNGAVIDINDDKRNEFEEIHENGKIEKAQESTEEVTDSQTQDDEGDEDDDDENSPIGLCRFIVKHHRLAFGIAMGAHLLMILITGILLAGGYEVIPINFSTLPLDLKDDSTKLRTDAWLHVRDDEAVVKLNGDQQLRSMEYQTFLFLYEKKGGNVFSKENLLNLQNFEKGLFMDSVYQNKLCQLEYNNSTNSTCKKPLSILRFFDGSYTGINANLYDPKFENIPKVLHAAQSVKLSKAILNFHLGKDAVISENVAESEVTRTLMYTGWPIEGYNSTDDRDEDQTEEMDKLIVDSFATKFEDTFKEGIGSMDFVYQNPALYVDATIKQVVLDMMLAVASFVFIFFFMWFQTGSLWITSLGIFSVISSFNIANLIYRVVFDYRYFGIFHVLSIFIILGIGSDNIFVFMDSWKQSHDSSHKNMAMRLTSVYKRAAKATLITSFTTMMAFLSNVQSPLLAISSFGLFSGILIIVNYLSVILFFPTVIMMYHEDRQGNCCCFPMCTKRVDTSQSSDMPINEKPRKSVSQYVIDFFEGPFFKHVITHKITRWVVLAIFTALLIVTVTFSTQLEPATEQINPWSDDTNWGRARLLSKDAFRPSQEDKVIVVHVVWGLKDQDRSECHHTDFECKGKTVFDKSFDLNPPPCQNAILDFCEKMKNLSPAQEDKLKLRRSQVTGEVEMECMFERMNEYLTDEGNKTRYPNGSKFDFPLNSAKMTTLMEYNPRIFNITVDELPPSYYRFFEVGLGYFITQGGSLDFASSNDYDKYQDLFGGQIDPTSIATGASIKGNKFGNRLLYVAIAFNTTLNPITLGYKDGLPIHDNWEEFIQNEMNNMPSSCNNGYQATVSVENEWQWLKVQEILVNSAFSGIGTGLGLALVVLTLATTNIIVGVMATITIGMVTGGVLGIIPILGWNLGVFESLNLTLVVGLAVDYVVHLADGYMELEGEDRIARVKYTLGHVGISVFSGACTTLGSSIFMLAAKIIFFQQFGIFIFCTIGLSILYSLILFTTVLAMIGPEGETGSLRPLWRIIMNFIRGKTKKHTDCKTCKGKGFHRIGLGEDNTPL